MSLAQGFVQLGAGLAVGLAGLAAGFAIGIVGDAGVRGTAQQPRLFVGMVGTALWFRLCQGAGSSGRSSSTSVQTCGGSLRRVSLAFSLLRTVTATRFC